MEKLAKGLFIFAILLSLSACGRDDEANPTDERVNEPEVEEVEEVEEGSENEEVVLSFDEQIEDTISIEGMEEPIILNLYAPVDAPFLTYVPEDLVTEEVSGGEGDAYYFYANYADEKLEDIYLQLYFFSKEITEQPSTENKDSTYGVATRNMDKMENVIADGWAIEEYISPEGSKTVALGEHEGQYFMVVIHSDVMYSEGFIPRANKVLEHLYWRDTEEYLVEEE